MMLAVSPVSALCHDVVLRLNAQESFFFSLGVSVLAVIFSPSLCSWGTYLCQVLFRGGLF